MTIFKKGKTCLTTAYRAVASHADVLTGSSRNLSSPRGVGTRDEPLRTFAWEANRAGYIPFTFFKIRKNLRNKIIMVCQFKCNVADRKLVTIKW